MIEHIDKLEIEALKLILHEVNSLDENLFERAFLRVHCDSLAGQLLLMSEEFESYKTDALKQISELETFKAATEAADGSVEDEVQDDGREDD